MQLVPFQLDKHFAQLLHWFQDPEIMRGMGMDLMSSDQLQSWVDDGKIILIAEDDGNTVGMVNFYNYKSHRPQVEVGYLVDAQYQGQGLATKILQEAIEYLEENYPEIEEITETYVEEFNNASKRVLEKNGFEMYLHRPEKKRYYYRLRLK